MMHIYTRNGNELRIKTINEKNEEEAYQNFQKETLKYRNEHEPNTSSCIFIVCYNEPNLTENDLNARVIRNQTYIKVYTWRCRPLLYRHNVMLG